MKLIRKLGSLRLTFLLLLVLAAVSVVGTVIAQGKIADFYVQQYGRIGSAIIFFFNADNLYYGWFYLAILACVWINLLICTLNSFNRSLLKNKRKLALLLIHCSILIIFTGSLVSKFSRQSKHVALLPGQSATLGNTQAKIYLKGFDIDYYEGSDRPKEYRSDIILQDKGQEDAEHKIIVNHPFQYKGFSLYQSSFEALADLNITISHMGRDIWQGDWQQGEFLQLPGNQDFVLELTHFIPDAQIDQTGNITLNSYKLGNTAVMISMYRSGSLVGSEWIFKDRKINDMIAPKIEVFDFKINRLDIRYASVIQIIKDPGIGFVWTGFLMLFTGMIVFVFNKRIF
jgi:cytochrome c biogenesis protein